MYFDEEDLENYKADGDTLRQKLILLKLEETYATEILTVIDRMLTPRYENYRTLSSLEGTIIASEFKRIQQEIKFLEKRKVSTNILLSQTKKSIEDVVFKMKMNDTRIREAEKEEQKCKMKLTTNKD